MTDASGVCCFTRNTPGLEPPAARNSAKRFGMVRKSWVTRMRPCEAAIPRTLWIAHSVELCALCGEEVDRRFAPGAAAVRLAPNAIAR